MEKRKTPSIAVNALLNAIRSILKIVLPLVTFPYIVRILGPQNYGKVNYCASIISYFALVAGLGINEYAVREGAQYRNDKYKMEEFASQIFSIQLLSTAISYLLLGIFLAFNIETDYKQIIFIQSINIILTTLGVEWLYTIYEDYLYITIRTFVFQAISIVLTLILVKHSENYKLYTGISTGSIGIGYLVSFFYSRKYVSLKITTRLNIKKHLKPILILFSSVALISIYINSDMTLLGIMQGDISVGLYEVSVKIYTMIKSVLNATVLVALPRLSTYVGEDRKEEYKDLAEKTLSSQIIVMLPAITGLFMMSKDIILIAAGEAYIEATNSLQILSIAMLFAVFANFYVYVVMISKKKDKQILFVTLISALINIGLNFLIIPLFSINGAAITTLLAELTVALLGFYYCHHEVPIRINRRLRYGTLLGCVSIIGICLLSENLCNNFLLKILVKIVGSIFVYAIIQMIINRNNFKAMIKNIFKTTN